MVSGPLGLTRQVPEARMQTSLKYLTSSQGRDLVPRGTLDALRFEASDLDNDATAGEDDALVAQFVPEPAEDLVGHRFEVLEPEFLEKREYAAGRSRRHTLACPASAPGGMLQRTRTSSYGNKIFGL
jgi:hypothetical protein